MNLGISLGCFNKMPIEAAINECMLIQKNFELKTIEIKFEREFDVPSLWPWEATESLEALLDTFDVIGAHLPFVYLNPICPNPYIKDLSMLLIKKSISKASDLGMTYVVMHARGQVNGMTYEDQLIYWQSCFKELSQYAKEKSIILTIENADSLADLFDLANIIKRIDSKWLKMTLDVGHAHLRKVPHLSCYPLKELILRGLDLFMPLIIYRGMPYERYKSISNFLNSEIDLISNMHLHDYDGRNDHISLGEGKIDFDFLREMAGVYMGTYVLEARLSKCDDFKKNYNFFRKLVC